MSDKLPAQDILKKLSIRYGQCRLTSYQCQVILGLVRAADEMLYEVDHYEANRDTPTMNEIFFKAMVGAANEYRKCRFNYDRKLREGGGT